MKDEIEQIVGKTISSVIVAGNTRPPRQQVFLVFSDDTYFEFYGDQFTCAGGVDRGGAAEAIRYTAEVMSAKITRIYPKDDTGSEPGIPG